VRIKTLLATLLVLSSVLSHQALASRKTDIITLYNGDRLTGEIISLVGAILELKTDAMGTVNIEWPEISNVESRYHYEVRLSDGQRLYGSFSEKSRPGQILLVDIFGKHGIESLQVVEIRPVEEKIAERIKAYTSAGFSYSKASSVAQLNFSTDLSYEDKQSRNTLKGRNDITRTDGDITSSTRWDLGRYTWSERRPDSFRAVFANYEQNEELDLEHRFGAGVGLGRYFINTNRSRYNGAVGLQVITEKSRAGDTNQDVEIYLNTNFAMWKFSTPEFDIDLSFSLYPSLTDSGRLRSDGSLRIRWELIKDLFWDITAWATTDNQAADAGRTTDYSITTGLGWKY